MSYQQHHYTPTSQSTPMPSPAAFPFPGGMGPPTAATGLRPLYFISRSNNTFVPLIPADELPDGMRIVGVSRVIGLEHTCGMQHVGYAPFTGMKFKAEDEPMAAPSQPYDAEGGHSRNHSYASSGGGGIRAPDALARQPQGKSVAPAYRASQTSRPLSAYETMTNWRSKALVPSAATPDKTQSLIDAITNTVQGAETASRVGYVPKHRQSAIASGKVPDPDKKEFCTYWIRTGECDYLQQGCLYKHEMPDKATLERIGFRGVPRWFAEKTAAVRLGAGGTLGRNIKPEEWLGRGSTSSHSDVQDDDADSSVGQSSDATDVEKAKTNTPESTRSLSVTGNPTCDGSVIDSPVTTSVGKSRRPSTTSIDLISFANAPLVASCPSSSPSSSSSSEKFQDKHGSGSAPFPTSNVFVPRGESAEAHIADAAKKRTRRITHLSAPPHAVVCQADVPPKCLQPVHTLGLGLMSSKHAPGTGNGKQKAKVPTTVALHQNGCRIRRPTTSSMSL